MLSAYSSIRRAVLVLSSSQDNGVLVGNTNYFSNFKSLCIHAFIHGQTDDTHTHTQPLYISSVYFYR